MAIAAAANGSVTDSKQYLQTLGEFQLLTKSRLTKIAKDPNASLEKMATYLKMAEITRTQLKQHPNRPKNDDYSNQVLQSLSKDIQNLRSRLITAFCATFPAEHPISGKPTNAKPHLVKDTKVEEQMQRIFLKTYMRAFTQELTAEFSPNEIKTLETYIRSVEYYAANPGKPIE